MYYFSVAILDLTLNNKKRFIQKVIYARTSTLERRILL